jgi:ribA/ribD-fused uncharacterized protein
MDHNYYFFWGGYCSQWAESHFEEFGRKFNTAEQFMMAAKAKVFNDEDAFNAIMATPNPREQKKLGRSVRNFDADVWNKVARAYVTLANYNKFTQTEKLYEFLKQRQNMYFVEASPYDKIWGIGLHTDNELINDPANWQGTNWLGLCINEAANLIFKENDDTGITALREELDWR